MTTAAAMVASKMTMVTVADGNDIGSGDGDSIGCEHYVGPFAIVMLKLPAPLSPKGGPYM